MWYANLCRKLGPHADLRIRRIPVSYHLPVYLRFLNRTVISISPREFHHNLCWYLQCCFQFVKFYNTLSRSVGTTRNTVIRLGWSRIGLAVLILHATGAGLIGRLAVISGRYNKCHSLQLQNHYAHFPPLQHTHIHAKAQLCGTGRGKWSWVSRHCMLAVAGGILCDRVKKPIGR